jgi:hypothetical protein
MTTPLRSDPIADHVTLVRAAAGGGATIPPAWEALRERLENLTNPGTPMLDRLISALIDGSTDLGAAYVMAMAEANDLQKGKVVGPLRAAALQKMRELYGKTAIRNYGAVAYNFDGLAKQFTELADIVDPESDAVALMSAPDKTRQAWQDIETYAHKLTESLPALSAAAQLCGIRDVDTDPVLLPLVCDPGQVHRRRVWEAWATDTGRCGRWAALHRANIPIHAYPADSLGSFESYRPARDIEHRLVPTGTVGVYDEITVDPESASYTPPEPPAMGLLPGRTLTR